MVLLTTIMTADNEISVWYDQVRIFVFILCGGIVCVSLDGLLIVQI